MKGPGPEEYTKFGRFSIGLDRPLDGELRVSGIHTILYVRDDSPFFTYAHPDGSVTGTLHDLTKVTLLRCQSLGSGSSTSGDAKYHYARIRPAIVVEGPIHIARDDASVVSASIVLEDAPSLFYDADAFSTVVDARPLIEQVANANGLGRPIPIGPAPLISYFAGRLRIAEVETVLGRVVVQHQPQWNLFSPRGVYINNSISISIETDAGVQLIEMIDRIDTLLRFLTLAIGRAQPLSTVMVRYRVGDEVSRLKTHLTFGPSREVHPFAEEESPHPSDVLFDPIREPDEFSAVLSAWLQSNEERHDARLRFEESFKKRTYSIQQFVGAANMFDLLPDSAVPKKVALPPQLAKAKEQCKKIFKALEPSYERSSVLGALGRVGTASLKQRALHRAAYVTRATPKWQWFPYLDLVVEEAVDCRNHYVHGSEARFDYSRNRHFVTFFTNTLEFVFAAAELIECGWNLERYLERAQWSHPFGEYRINYKLRVQALRDIRDGKGKWTGVPVRLD